MSDNKERVYSEEDLCEYTILQKIDELEKQLKAVKAEASNLYETKENANAAHRLLRSNDAKINNKLDALTKVTPTDVGVKDNKLGLLHDTTWLTNQDAINLDGFTYDEATKTLKASKGVGVSPTLNLTDNSGNIRTAITETEYNNLTKGLYNQVIYSTDNEPLSVCSPSKLFNTNGEYGFIQFKLVANTAGSFSYSSMTVRSITIGAKNISNEYPITITDIFTINPPSVSGGGIPTIDDITFSEEVPVALTDEQVAKIKTYNQKYIFVKTDYKDDGTTYNDLSLGYVLDWGDLGLLILIAISPVFHSIGNNLTFLATIGINNNQGTLKHNGTIALPKSSDNGKVLTVVNEQPVWSTPTFNNSKTISLFGKHSILVPKDSTDTNIDLYRHDIEISNDNDEELYLTYYSSSNLLVDSFTDLNTLLSNKARYIMVNGFIKEADKVYSLLHMNWNGTYANSTFDYLSLDADGIPIADSLTRFTNISDTVTTI